MEEIKDVVSGIIELLSVDHADVEVAEFVALRLSVLIVEVLEAPSTGNGVSVVAIFVAEVSKLVVVPGSTAVLVALASPIMMLELFTNTEFEVELIVATVIVPVLVVKVSPAFVNADVLMLFIGVDISSLA